MWDWFTNSSTLTPHGFCLFWEPGLLWLNAGADGLTMLAYASIPIALIWFMRRRTDLPDRLLPILFAGFILACGATHGMTALTLWVPAYHAEAIVKVLTAVLSVATAIALWRIMPKLLAIPSMARMAALNKALLAANDDLERRVAERTADLVRLDESVRRSELRFRLVVDAAPNGVVMTNAGGTIEMVNAQTERLFGYKREELIGHPVEMLLPGSARGRHPVFYAEFFARPRPRQMGFGPTLSGQRKDGSLFEVEIGLNPIETDDGLMVLAAIVDISHRLRIEAQLRQAQKMEAVGRVAAGVAHDFNNLLMALSGSLEMLMDRVIDDPVAVEWLQIAIRGTARGGDLTGRLLAFSRQQILQARPVPVARMLGDLQSLIRTLFETAGVRRIELVIVGCDGDLCVSADPAQLEAALINLAVNARDAMASTGGCLRISAYEAEADPAIVPPGRYTVISVADTGTGMTPETLAQACEPFFTTKGLNGTGLGLSMVQGFARQSGGEAHIVSAVGEGTTIDLWLPSATMSSRGAPTRAAPAKLRGRVLLVDDSPDVLVVVGAFLRHASLDVTTAAGGDLALQAILTGERFDVIVTDFAMPGMTGVELLLQAHEIDPSVAGIIITGFAESVVRDQDNVSVLRKPFNRAELIATVRDHVKLGVRA